MNIEKIKIEDFVALPRKIKHDYVAGKLTRNEFDVLIWIWINTNPYNGYFTADYKTLEREFRNRINYNNMRKIISNLRKVQHIYFLNHKGRKGSFPIYPLNFLLTNSKIQTMEYLKNHFSITTRSQSNSILDTQLQHNRGERHHSFKEQKHSIYSGYTQNPKKTITTPYNNNDNDNDNKERSSFKKLKPFFRGDEMRKDRRGKWWVIPKDDGPWLEFAGSEKDIEFK